MGFSPGQRLQKLRQLSLSRAQKRENIVANTCYFLETWPSSMWSFCEIKLLLLLPCCPERSSGGPEVVQKGQAGASLYRNHSQISSSAWSRALQLLLTELPCGPGQQQLSSLTIPGGSAALSLCPALALSQCHLCQGLLLPPPTLPMALHNPSRQLPAAQVITQTLHTHLHDPLKPHPMGSTC